MINIFYVLMCGGEYDIFKTPKQLSVVKGERLVDRTIRLLRENGIDDDHIFISTNNPLFADCGVPIITHKNSYKYENGVLKGYWLDAFYPYFEEDDQVCYIFGDVYFTENAIKTIVDYYADKNTLFGSAMAKNELHENWGEPFAYKVVDYKRFMNGVTAVKSLQDAGLTKRMPIVWELYRYLNGLDINIQQVKDDTFVVINDGTIDVDSPEELEKLNEFDN